MPMPLTAAWNVFSNPLGLAAITPLAGDPFSAFPAFCSGLSSLSQEVPHEKGKTGEEVLPGSPGP